MIPKIVYLLCALTSTACALALTRGYLRTQDRLLMWSSLGFAGLAVSNLLLVLDLIIFPQIDLMLWRTLATCVSVALLLGGLVWDSN